MLINLRGILISEDARYDADRGEDKNLISLSSTESIGGGVRVTMASD